jgi:transposase
MNHVHLFEATEFHQNDGQVAAQLLDIVPGRGGHGTTGWLQSQSGEWRSYITHGTMELSSAYQKVLLGELPDVTLVADLFHVVKLATSKLDEVRRRVQNETFDHRGRKGDPLYRSRRMLTRAEERLSEDSRTRLVNLLEAEWRGRHRLARQGGRTGVLQPPGPTSGTSLARRVQR